MGQVRACFCKQTVVAACIFEISVKKWKLHFVSCNSRSCDFAITRLISDQIALHSVQLPLLIMCSEWCILLVCTNSAEKCRPGKNELIYCNMPSTLF